MTPQEKTIVMALIAVAWSDGEMQTPEAGVVEGLLSGFDATDEEEAELLAYAKSPRALRDIAIRDLSRDDRETLMRNATLLVNSDDDETAAESAVLRDLAELLEFDTTEREEIVASIRAGIRHLNRGDAGS
jgi:uncharacterized membrane protein YebE (DUF533 family)